jgi:hypothetical protein
MMDDVNDIVNLGRRLYREGDYCGAHRVFTEVGATIDGRSAALENPAFAAAIDAATMVALTLLDTGRRPEARRMLEDLHPRLFPDLTDPSAVVDAITDPEQRSTFVFGQLKLVELAADELDPPVAIIRLLGALEPAANRTDNPLLVEYAALLRARVKRLIGQWRQAAEDWIHNARRISKFAAHPDALHSGYPASRSVCEAVLTLEAVDETSRSLTDLLESFETDDRWDAEVLAGVGSRREPRASISLALTFDDVELQRTTADAWYCSLVSPSDRESVEYTSLLEGAPLACRLCYSWRAARHVLQKTLRVPPPLLEFIDALLSRMDDGLRRDYGLPPTAARLVKMPGTTLSRCIAI